MKFLIKLLTGAAILFVFFLLLTIKAFAMDKPDEWLCTSQGISRSGNVIDSCGVGEGSSETKARANALDAAMDEFRTICRGSADCDIKNVSMHPKRMSCTGYPNGMWKCYRLIEVILGT